MNPLLAIPPEALAEAVCEAMQRQIDQWQAEKQAFLDLEVPNGWIN